jgi:hypothetical protein
MTAIAFLFSVFLARPCPFYILDEVEAALDDLNIGRFLDLLETYAERAQFIVVTHQKRTMEAADTLYGVSMGDDGVSKVISRRLPPREIVAHATAPARPGGSRLGMGKRSRRRKDGDEPDERPAALEALLGPDPEPSRRGGGDEPAEAGDEPDGQRIPGGAAAGSPPARHPAPTGACARSPCSWRRPTTSRTCTAGRS